MSMDDHIRRRLENHRSEVDTDALWAALEPEVKRKRWGGLWMIPIIIAMIGISLISFVGMSEAILLVDETGQNLDSAFFWGEEGFITETKMTQLSTLDKGEEVPEDIAFAVSTEEKVWVQGVNGSSSIIIRNDAQGRDGLISNNIQEPEADSDPRYMIDYYKPIEARIVNSNSIDLYSLPIVRKEASLEELDMVRPKDINIESKKDLKLNSLKEVVVGIPKWSFSLGLDFSYGISDKILDGDIKYKLYRNHTEKHKMTHVVFPNALLRHKSGLTIRTGVKFINVKEQFSYTPSVYENSRYPSSLPALTSETDPTGMVTPLSDKEEINTYKFIDIPFFLGFETKEKKGMSFLFEAGVAANISVETKGTGLNHRGAYMIIDNNRPYSVFKGNGGWSVLGRIGSRYTINKKFSVTGGVDYTHQMDSMTKESYSLSQKFKILGVNVGMNYTF